MERITSPAGQTPREVEYWVNVVEVSAATALELAFLSDTSTADAGDGGTDVSCKETSERNSHIHIESECGGRQPTTPH